MKRKGFFKIVAFGDSITLSERQECNNKWVNIVGDALAKKFSDLKFIMINAGVGGNTSREALARFNKDVLLQDPDMVLVELGGNDANPSPEKEVLPNDFNANLTTMYEQTLSINAQFVLLTFPPVIDEWHCWKDQRKYLSFNGLDGYIEQYRCLTRQFAENHGVPLVDIDRVLRETFTKSSPEKIILSDGIHLTALANHVIAQAISERLNKEISLVLNP